MLGAVMTVLIYQTARRLSERRATLLLSPLLLCPLLLIALLTLLHISYDSYNAGGKILTYMLQPATVAFAVPMYKNKRILREYKVEILASTVGAAVIAIVSSVGLAEVIGLPHQEVTSMAPRSITTPMAVALSQELSGDPAMTAVFVIATGLAGVAIASAMLKHTANRNPITTGLMLGIAAHGTGTSKAYEFGGVEGAIASLAMIFMGIITTVIAPGLVPQCIQAFGR